MDGLLLADGKFIERDTQYHIDMVHKLFPDCKDVREAVSTHKCIFIVEYHSLHGGVHEKDRDYLICHGEEGNEATDDQMNFLKENIKHLTMSQMIIIPELSEIAGFSSYEKCYECIDFEKRFDFIRGKVEFATYSEQQKYYSGNYKPNDYCECCKCCNIN